MIHKNSLFYSTEAGVDFRIPLESFNFTTSPSEECVNIYLLSDISIEGNQSFSVTLGTPSPQINTNTGSTDITILDQNGQLS